MANINLDFSVRDFTSNFEWLLSLLRDQVPELTDLNHSDAGISLIRLLCSETDQLGFYLDEVFGEGYITSAKYKQSLVDLGHLVDCLPKLASPARTTIRLTRYNDTYFNQQIIHIPIYSEFTRSDGITYVCMSEYNIPVGTAHIDIPVIQGKITRIHLDPNDFIQIDNTKYNKYNLGANVAANCVLVYETGTEFIWTEEESFWRSGPTDKHFVLHLFADNYNGVKDTVFLVLGDGINGSDCPVDGLDIVYLTTDCRTGNCGTGVISGIPNGLMGIVSCTNTVIAIGGAVTEDIEAYRKRLPRVVRTQRRGVIKTDYSALIESIPGISSAQAADSNDSWNWPHVYVGIYILPEGGYTLNDYITELVYEQVTSWGHLGTWRGRYILAAANQLVKNITYTFGVAPGHNPSTVQAALVTAITNYFAPGQFAVGEDFSFADFFITMNRTAGVSWIDFSLPTSAHSATPIGSVVVMGTISGTVVD